MRVASLLPVSDPNAPPWWRRFGALALTIFIHLLLLLLLVQLAPPMFVPVSRSTPTVVSLLPDRGIAPTPDKTVAKTKQRAGGARPKAAVATVTRPRAATVPRPPTPAPPLQMMQLSRDEFAAADIAKLPSHAAERATGSADASGTGTGTDSGSDSGAGAGPGGERLFNAQWQREPTHAELVTYLPGNVPENAWGEIACRTIDHFHVEDCRALDESPSGSGIARGLRQAAWQFLVRPPRVGGKSMIGSWVRIRIDFTKGEVEVHRGG